MTQFVHELLIYSHQLSNISWANVLRTYKLIISMTGDLCLVYFIVVLILSHKRVLRIVS